MLTYAYPPSIAVRTTEPTLAQEPITPDEAKGQCGIRENNAHDEWINGAIPAARFQVESDLDGLVCYAGEFTWNLTEFPAADWFSLPKRPVSTQPAIAYVNTAGTSTVWSTSEYALKTRYRYPRIVLAYSYSWPTLRGDQDGITITFTAGYGTVLAIPQEIKTAVKLALHIQWLLKMENPTEAERQQLGYDRWIELIRPTNYR